MNTLAGAFHCFCLILLLGLPGPALARVTPEEAIPLMDAFLLRTVTPGMVVAVLEPGEAPPLVLARGLAQVENSVPMRPDAVLRYGSISKIVTALHARHCIAQGKLTPEMDIRPYFPELKLPTRITVQHLMRHTSGLPELLRQPEILANPAKEWTPGEILAVMAGKPLLFAPGTRQQYSNTGYLLLNLLLEKVDMPTQAWLTAHGHSQPMPAVRVIGGTSPIPRMSSGYGKTPDNDLSLPMWLHPSLARGAGDIGGNAVELLRLVPLMRAFDALPKAPQAPLLADGTAAGTRVDGDRHSYFLSQMDVGALFDLGGGRVFLGKDGMFPGFVAQLLYNPRNQRAVAILVNQEQACAEAFDLAVRLLEAP